MLTKVHIKNFKSLKDVTLTFGPNNVLVGPNMSGKSNLVDFFRFVRDLLFPAQTGLNGVYGAFNPRNGFPSVTWKGAQDPVILFQLEAAIGRKPRLSTWKYEVSLLGNFQYGGVNVYRENLSVTDEAGTAALIETNDQRRDIYARDGKKISEVADPGRLGLEYEFPNWDGIKLRRSIFSWRFYNLIPQDMRKSNPTAAPDSLNPAGDNLSAWLMLLQTRYSESFDRVRSAAKDILPGVDSIFTSPTPQSTVYLASNETHLSAPITVAEMSDGELAFIALLSLLYAPQKLRPDICFVEEPENHLHPRLMSILTGLLQQVQREHGRGNGQLFLTTHSPYLLDKFSIEDLLVFSKKEGATVVTRPGDRDELKTLITDEQIGLGELYYSGVLSGA